MHADVVDALVGLLRRRYPRGLTLSWRGCGRVNGVFIAFEGIDGAGLTTHSKIAVRVMEKLVYSTNVYYTKEPTRGPVGGLIREVLARRVDESLGRPEVLALLFAADRLYHLYKGLPCGGTKECILNNPSIIISDRYKYSSIVYQSVDLDGAPGAPRLWLEAVNSYAPPPHVLVYLDVDPEIAAKRVSERGGGIQIYESIIIARRLRERFREVLDALKAEGEVTINYGEGGIKANKKALWEGLIPSCAYPPGVYPRVVEEATSRREVEDVAFKLVPKLVEVLVDIGLLRPL
ncbi:MAG: dTMP kinase [Desulfurococcales archaeon]|nr:dTMP kinase [Desulfurococcales archaeon]